MRVWCRFGVLAVAAVLLTWRGDAFGAAAQTKGKVPLTIATSADVNPDVTGRPSPIVLRIYQLRADVGFLRADFFSLYDDEQKVLGSELVIRDEFVMGPKEIRNAMIEVAEDARVVGVVAAFRDFRNSEWRGSVAGPIRGLTISIERSRLVLFPD